MPRGYRRLEIKLKIKIMTATTRSR